MAKERQTTTRPREVIERDLKRARAELGATANAAQVAKNANRQKHRANLEAVRARVKRLEAELAAAAE